MYDTKPTNKSDFLFYGLLIHIFIFYTQIGGRISFLGAIRIEFLWGSLILLITTFKIVSKQIVVYPNKLNFFIILFLMALLVGIPFSFWKRNALNSLIQLIKFISIYLLIITTIDDKRKLKIFMWIYILLITQIFFEPFTWAIRGQGFVYNSGAMRLFGRGIWAHPNSLGGIIASHLPFFYFLFLYEKTFVRRAILASLALMGVGTILFTSSRTAFVALLAFCFLILITSKKKLLATTLLTIALIFLWMFAPQESKDRFLTLKKADDIFTEEGTGDSMSGRWRIIQGAYQVFLENPIFGVGMQNFMGVSGVKFDIWLPTHNLYLQLLAETGLLGTITFFLLMIQIIKNLRRSATLIEEKNLQSSFENCSLKIVSYFLVLRLVLGLLGDDLIEYYWWMSGGLSIVILRLVDKNSHESSKAA